MQLKPSKRLVATKLNPEKLFIRQYITSAIKSDKVSMKSFNFIEIFLDVPQGSILAMWDMRYVFWQYGIDFFPSMFGIHIDKCKVVPIYLSYVFIGLPVIG